MHRKLKNILLISLTLALTLLSLKAQYQFWKGLFGNETAIIASSVFEILRLSSLYILLKYEGKKRLTGLILYLGIALFCGAVAITSWHAEVLETYARQEAIRMNALKQKMDIIREAYAIQISERIKKLDQDLYYIDSQIAKNPSSTYWTTRREQILVMKNDLLNEREGFLSEIPDNPELWIDKNAAILGVQLDQKQVQDMELNSLEKALTSTWRMTPESAKKIVAIVFVIAIEIGIILLAAMTEKRHISDKPVTRKRSLVTILKNKYEEDDIRMFIEKSRDRFNESGVLPRACDLTMRLRPIRMEIKSNGYRSEDLKALFDYYSNTESG